MIFVLFLPLVFGYRLGLARGPGPCLGFGHSLAHGLGHGPGLVACLCLGLVLHPLAPFALSCIQSPNRSRPKNPNTIPQSGKVDSWNGHGPTPGHGLALLSLGSFHTVRLPTTLSISTWKMSATTTPQNEKVDCRKNPIGLMGFPNG